MKISSSQLHLISQLRPTLELAEGGYGYSEDVVRARLRAALHEAAHIVASLACRGSAVLGMSLATKKHRHGWGGICHTAELYPDEESLVHLAGYIWEERHGNTAMAQGDYLRGFKPHRAYMLDRAREVVIQNERLIVRAAVGILALIPKHGTLSGRRLQKFVKWLRPQVKPYASLYRTGELPQSENW